MGIIEAGCDVNLNEEYKRNTKNAMVMAYFGVERTIGMLGDLRIILSTNVSEPTIKGLRVLFPYVEEKSDLQVFKDSAKCLFYASKGWRTAWSPRSRLCFAGVDDKSYFVTELRAELYDTFIKFGENAFLEALKPELTKKLEMYLNTACQRQGDMFITSIPYTETFCRDFTIPYIYDADNFGINIFLPVKKRPVLGTRHTFSGQYYEMGSHIRTVLVADGMLEAPNHPAMELKGVHIIQQNAGLVSPRFAD